MKLAAKLMDPHENSVGGHKNSIFEVVKDGVKHGGAAIANFAA